MIGVGTGRIPDGIAPVVAYRAWRHATSGDGQPGLLSVSIYGRAGWVIGEWNRAICGRQDITRHEAPEEGCQCGFYATRDLETLVGLVLGLSLEGLGPPVIAGRVLLAGKVIEHDHGYRAEQARVLDLLPALGGEPCAECIAAQLGVGVSRELIERWDELSLPRPPTDRPPRAPGSARPIAIPARDTASARRAVPVRRVGLQIAAVLLIGAVVVAMGIFAPSPLILGLFFRGIAHRSGPP